MLWKYNFCCLAYQIIIHLMDRGNREVLGFTLQNAMS